jgi:FkbM family methyltransferase
MIFNLMQALLNYKELLYFENYGEVEMHLVRHLCERKREAIDVGANSGGYIHFMSKYAKRVHAFEPIQAFHAGLRKKFPRVQLWPVGLSDVSRALDLAIPRINGQLIHGCATASPIAAASYPECESLRINFHALDDLYYGNVAFIKIDVEGHEMEVLRGAAGTIRRCQPRILVEIDEHLNPGGLEEITEFFAPLQYQGLFAASYKLHTIDKFDADLYQNPMNRLDLTADLKSRDDTGQYVSNFIFLPIRDPPSLLGKIQTELGWLGARRS